MLCVFIVFIYWYLRYKYLLIEKVLLYVWLGKSKTSK